jgi:rhomboid family GlyGly-CTERM serine protease
MPPDHSIEDNRSITPGGMKSGSLWLAVAICGLLIALEWAGHPGREYLRYERAGLEGGELWRLLTGHVVHLGWQHLGLNLAGVALMWVLFAGAYRWWQWLVIGVAAMLCIDAGLYVFSPELEWYVGLSGVLHGVMAAGAVAYWRRGDSLAWVVAGFLLAKLLWEQWAGALPWGEVSAGGAVVVDAHLYGALGGALVASFFRAPRIDQQCQA